MEPAIPSSQCTARSSRTGERCKRLVRGGGVCPTHGGSAPQVRAAREARILEMRSRAYGEVEERSPAEALLAASGSLDATLQRLEQLAADGGGADAVILREIRSAASESARVAKLVQDAGLDERRLQLMERDQVAIGRVLELVLAAYGLEASSVEVRQTVAEALERVRAGDGSPLRSRVVVDVPQINGRVAEGAADASSLSMEVRV